MEKLNQAVEECDPIEREKYTEIDSQLWNVVGDFEYKLKDVSSILPFRGIDSDELQKTLNELVDKIKIDSQESCLKIASIINNATDSLSSQDLVDKYTNELQESLPNKNKGFFGGYNTRNDQIIAQLRDAGV